MARFSPLATLLAPALILALTSCTPEAEAPPAEALRQVVVQPARLGAWATGLTLTGEIRARRSSSLSFQSPGRLVGWSVDTGARVEAGQLLAALDSRQQRAAHEGAQAALAAAEAQFEQARLQHGRLAALIDQGATTRSALDEAATSLRAAAADTNRARAELAAASRALADTELRAPVAGVIIRREGEAGQILQAAQAVFILAEDGPRDAVFDVQEAALLSLPPEPRISLHPLGAPERSHPGRLHEIAPALDLQTGTVQMSVEILAAPEALQLGAPIVMEVEGESRAALVLPLPLPAMLENRPAIWTLSPGSEAQTGTARAVIVEILAYSGERIVLAPGALPEGALVVIEGPRGLREGQMLSYEVRP